MELHWNFDCFTGDCMFWLLACKGIFLGELTDGVMFWDGFTFIGDWYDGDFFFENKPFKNYIFIYYNSYSYSDRQSLYNK